MLWLSLLLLVAGSSLAWMLLPRAIWISTVGFSVLAAGLGAAWLDDDMPVFLGSIGVFAALGAFAYRSRGGRAG